MHKSLISALACFSAVGMLASGALAGAGVEPLTTTRVASGLSRPLYAISAPGDYKRLFIVEQRGSGGVANSGAIRILDLTTNPPTLLATRFLTLPVLTASEQGLLGLAFHPDYWKNGYFYVYATVAGGGAAGHDTVLRYQVSADPNVADAGSQTSVISWNDPFSNHNGGWISFGPDGYLYISSGDGGSETDPSGFGQSVTTFFGKMLRIDVNTDGFPEDPVANYSIPPTNPFLAPPQAVGLDEIWAYGLRNPWRCSFDRLTGDLWMGDVGQDAIEEIDMQPANVAGTMPGQAGYQGGKNYGWKCKEGFSCYSGGAGCCATGTFVNPVLDYNHASDADVPGISTGASVTGGFVYRGCAIPTLQGTYFYADYTGSRIWSFSLVGGVVTNWVTRTAELDPPGTLSISNPAGFGEDARGELYVCDLSGGELFKIVPVTPTIDIHDLNCDGHVNGLDLAQLLAAWGPTPPGGSIADFDFSGFVNGIDLAGLLAAWVP